MEYILAFEENRIIFIKGKQRGKKLCVYASKSFDLPLDLPNYSTQKQIDEIYSALVDIVANLKLKNKNVKMLLSSKGMMFRELMLPKVKKSNVRPLMHNELVYYYNNMDDYVVDYVTTGKKTNDEKSGYMAYAIRKDYFKVHLLALEKLSLKVQSAGVTSLSFSKLYKICYPNQKSYLVTVFDKDYFVIYFYENGICILMRWFKITNGEYWNDEEFLIDKISEQISRVVHFGYSRNVENRIETVSIIDNIEESTNFKEILDRGLKKSGNINIECVPFDFDKIICFVGKDKSDNKDYQLFCGEFVNVKDKG